MDELLPLALSRLHQLQRPNSGDENSAPKGSKLRCTAVAADHIACLLAVAHHERREHVHALLARQLAGLMDQQAPSTLRSTQLPMLAAESVALVLQHVADLPRAVEVSACCAWLCACCAHC